MSFNFDARQLIILFPAYYCGNFVNACFMLHDEVTDSRYKITPNKVEQYKQALLLEHPDRRVIDLINGCSTAHNNKVFLDNFDILAQCEHANYYSHCWHRARNSMWSNEEEHPEQEEWMVELFSNTSVITIMPDAEVHPSRLEISNQAIYRNDLPMFYPGNEIWYVKKYNIPHEYIKFSDIINKDRDVFLDRILTIADQFNWPMASEEVLRDFINVYHATVLADV